jgi:hypothetical protein
LDLDIKKPLQAAFLLWQAELAFSFFFCLAAKEAKRRGGALFWRPDSLGNLEIS